MVKLQCALFVTDQSSLLLRVSFQVGILLEPSHFVQLRGPTTEVQLVVYWSMMSQTAKVGISYHPQSTQY